jgi:hypothetical protein
MIRMSHDVGNLPGAESGRKLAVSADAAGGGEPREHLTTPYDLEELERRESGDQQEGRRVSI